MGHNKLECHNQFQTKRVVYQFDSVIPPSSSTLSLILWERDYAIQSEKTNWCRCRPES